MPRLELHEFTPDFVDEAARLLAERHAAQRAIEPGLPAAFDQLETTRAAVAERVAGGATGAVATRGGTIVGYLLGTLRPDAVWGPNVWVEADAHAVRDPETARDLYGLAAARWVEDERTYHYAVVPATDRPLVDAWFRLGFGQQHVHAIGDLSPTVSRALGPGLEIRRARREDIDALAHLERVLPVHQRRSPVFSSLPPPELDEARAGWAADFDDPAFATFVAVVDGEVVGSAIGCPVEKSGLHTGIVRPAAAAHLGFAAVSEHARGRGTGSALGGAVLGWASSEGYAWIVTDWRATNLLSSRTWPRLGFRPTYLRLFRAVVE